MRKIHIVSLYNSSKFNNIISIGIEICKVTGLIKNPSNVKLLKIKSKKVFIFSAKSLGNAGIFIQEKQVYNKVLNKFNIKLEPKVRTYGSKGEISWDTL